MGGRALGDSVAVTCDDNQSTHEYPPTKFYKLLKEFVKHCFNFIPKLTWFEFSKPPALEDLESQLQELNTEAINFDASIDKYYLSTLSTRGLAGEDLMVWMFASNLLKEAATQRKQVINEIEGRKTQFLQTQLLLRQRIADLKKQGRSSQAPFDSHRFERLKQRESELCKRAQELEGPALKDAKKQLKTIRAQKKQSLDLTESFSCITEINQLEEELNKNYKSSLAFDEESRIRIEEANQKLENANVQFNLVHDEMQTKKNALLQRLDHRLMLELLAISKRCQELYKAFDEYKKSPKHKVEKDFEKNLALMQKIRNELKEMLHSFNCLTPSGDKTAHELFEDYLKIKQPEQAGLILFGHDTAEAALKAHHLYLAKIDSGRSNLQNGGAPTTISPVVVGRNQRR